MKFVRFGALKLHKQEQYEEPVPDMVPWLPPCKKGFFAFPAGYMDSFYLPLSRPPENPHSLLQYLRDDDGNKMMKKELYIHAYERALRKASGFKFGKKKEYQRQMKIIGYFGAREWNATFSHNGMFEVFFDQRIP